MDHEMMFDMEEVSAKRAPCVPRRTVVVSKAQRNVSVSEDDDEDYVICPILSDPSKEICDYLKSLVLSKSLSSSLPKSSFTFQVSHSLPQHPYVNPFRQH